MREIKFRAKKGHWKDFVGWDEWLYANGYYFDGFNYWFTIPDKNNSAIAWAKHKIIDPETLAEYTGLKDCKRTGKYPEGQEIYEGDILQCQDPWQKEPTGTKYYVYWDKGGGWSPLYGINMAGMTVIGNIYEKPVTDGLPERDWSESDTL